MLPVRKTNIEAQENMWFLVFGQIEEVFIGGQGTVVCKDNSNRIKNILIDNSFHTWLLILLYNST